MKKLTNTTFFWLSLLMSSWTQLSQAQTIMFDDFTYTGLNDAQLPTFNQWNIINGISGPPEGGQYSRDNIAFVTDPGNSGNKLMSLRTTVNGQTKATTHARIETAGFDYFEGTYAARVYFSDTPYDFQDANIQTFYTIVGSQLGGDGSRYSELDFEYMASDKWGISPNNKVMYLTAWNRYIANPWQAWKRYFSSQQSYAGWHTYTVSCTDGANVKFWIDNTYMGAMSTTDSDGTSVYPRNPMQVAFANWIWNNVVGSSTQIRETKMQVDWVLFYKNQEKTPQQIADVVATYRSQGLQRRNLAGNTYVTNTGGDNNPGFDKLIQAESYTNMGGVQLENTTDAGRGQNVGWIDAGDWMSYTNLIIPSTGTYKVEYRVASLNGGGHLSLDIGAGATVLDETGIPSTGGWQNWTTISHMVNLPAGTHNFGIYASSGGWNINWWRISRQSSTSARMATSATETNAEAFILYPNPVGDELKINLPPGNSDEVKIINNTGQVVLKTRAIANTIDISVLKPGVYQVQIGTGDNVTSHRIVKK